MGGEGWTKQERQRKAVISITHFSGIITSLHWYRALFRRWRRKKYPVLGWCACREASRDRAGSPSAPRLGGKEGHVHVHAYIYKDTYSIHVHCTSYYQFMPFPFHPMTPAMFEAKIHARRKGRQWKL